MLENLCAAVLPEGTLGYVSERACGVDRVEISGSLIGRIPAQRQSTSSRFYKNVGTIEISGEAPLKRAALQTKITRRIGVLAISMLLFAFDMVTSSEPRWPA